MRPTMMMMMMPMMMKNKQKDAKDKNRMYFVILARGNIKKISRKRERLIALFTRTA